MISENIPVVRGEECLQYIDRPIGFFDRSETEPEFANNRNASFGNAYWYWTNSFNCYIWSSADYNPKFTHRLKKWYQDPNKRIIGYVQGYSDDGGVQIKILGDGHEMKASGSPTTPMNPQIGDVLIIRNDLIFDTMVHYKYSSIISNELVIDRENPYYSSLVEYARYGDVDVRGGGFYGSFYDGLSGSFVPYDDAIGYEPEFDCYLNNNWEGDTFWCGNQVCQGHTYETTMDANTTIEFGHIYDVYSDLNMQYQTFYAVPKMFIDYPQSFITGNLYEYLCNLWEESYYGLPGGFVDPDDPQFPIADIPFRNATFCEKVNLTSIPCNIILTSDYGQAIRYLNDGTLPFDAKLYPLDWDHLPQYDVPQPEPVNPDDPDDEPDDNDPDDDSRDVTPNPPVIPSFTPPMLSNYNFYWLKAPQYSDFIQWFWNDIGAYNDFDDLIAKVEGLYNDVASAVLMCRFFPVELSWIGGAGNDENIVVGMIEKAGAVNTISKTNQMIVRDIGSIQIPTKYNSFMDFAPYTQMSLYLPFHGFVDLDIDIFMGTKTDKHTLDVKGVYDFLTGTLQYFIYCDNKWLVNSFVVKLAVDLPLTLQTKNDRDSATFQNVSSVVGGLIGAGAGIISGNPIGMALGVTQGVQSINSATQSAPMNVRGTVGESGAMYAPPQCAIILRRPTIAASDKNADDKKATWKKNNGMLCGYGWELSSLKGKGLTICTNPRINFSKGTPLQAEIDEIYQILEQGVIL